MIDTIKVDKGLFLREISPKDAGKIFGIINANREYLGKCLPFVALTKSVRNTMAFIDQLQKPYSREMVFTINYHGKIAGLIGFKDIDRTNCKFEIGYWITAEYEGNGIVTRCCKATIDMAFEKMEMNRVQITCGVKNIRSINIPKRLGFQFEGVERAGEMHDNKFIDLAVYSMLKIDWKRLLGRGGIK